MKITFDNFRSVYPEVEKWLDEETKRDFKDSEGLDEFYSQDDEIKGMFDTIIREMNEAVAKHEADGKKPEPKPATPKADKPKAKPSEKKEYTAKKVDYIIFDMKELMWNKPSGFSEVKQWDKEGHSVVNDAHISKEINFTRKVTDADLGLIEKLIDNNCRGGNFGFEPSERNEIEAKYGKKYIYAPFSACLMDCIAILENDKPVYIIDAQGYDYARYIHLVSSDSKVDKKKGLKWLEENFKDSRMKKIMADINAERAKHHGFTKGDKVMFEGKVCTIKDFDNNFREERVVIDVFGNGIILEVVPYSKISKIDKPENDKPTPEPTPKPTPAAPKSTPISFKGKYVDQVSEEVKAIARYITLQGKTIAKANASKDAPRVQLNALQKTIREKRIRKTSQYAKEIMDIQNALIRMVNGSLSGALKGSDIINITDYDHLKEIATSEKVSEVATFAKTFIRIQGATGKEKEAKSLLAKIEKSKENGEEIDSMKAALKNYIDGKTDKIKANEQTLRGLYGICSGYDSLEGGVGVMNSIAIENKHFEVLDFKGKWEGFFGRPDLHFRFMFYGRPGNGKSTLALQLAGYLSKEMGKKVLYVAKEEGFGYTLQEKINRLGVSNANLFLADDVPSDLSAYDVVFLDSVNTLRLTPEDLKKLPKDKAYVYVFQSTKDGKYMGAQEYGHDVDAVVKIEQMVATKDKNRFGGEVLKFKVG